MSVSKKEFCKNVSLGPLEPVLRERLKTGEVMDLHFFPMTILSLKNVNNVKARFLCVDTPPLKFNGSRMYVLHLPEFLIFYNASKKVQFNASDLSFRPDGLLNIGEEQQGQSNKYLNTFYRTIHEMPR